MEHRKITYRQKKTLIEFVTKHPELITCKVTPEFNYRDSQRLWQTIAKQCNAIPGSKKTWRQWRKTWQDLRSKAKKRQAEGMFPPSLVMLSQAEQEALGLKNAPSNSNTSNTDSQENTEFVLLEQNNEEENFHTELDDMSEPASPPETKVFSPKKKYKSELNLKNSTKYKSSKHSNNCVFNCDLLAVHERRKVELKEGYIKFKKDYLRQKLKLLKEQTQALKMIAKELSEK